jgi:hypothetical protein
MHSISMSALVLGFLATTYEREHVEPQAKLIGPDIKVETALALAQDTQTTPARKRWGKFTIGKATTFVTGPLDKDGAIDYAAALNNHLRRGVTPENNANVLLWKALGPDCDKATRPPKFFSALGMEAPAPEGDYFIDGHRFMKEHLQIASHRVWDRIDDQMDRAKERPWTSREYPEVASWLKMNEKPLALVVEATRRSDYYAPLLPKREREETTGLVSAMLPGAQSCRELVAALVARAMLRCGRGDYDDAWQDLLACHRLARLIARGRTLIHALIGMALDRTACDADLAFLEHTAPNGRRATELLGDLQSLSPLPGLVEALSPTERFMFLDNIMMLRRYGLQYLDKMSGVAAIGDPDQQSNRILAGIDWDPALRNANSWFDRLAGAAGEKERAARERTFDQIEKELKALSGLRGEMGAILRDEKQSAEARGKAIGDILITLLIPALRKVQHAADRAAQIRNNLHSAFALAQYYRAEGHYPKELEALVPTYLGQVPPDIFSGQPLIYLSTRHNYLLYSVGINGQDEDGRGDGDEPPADDLSVRMQAPGLSQGVLWGVCAGFVLLGTVFMVVRDRCRRGD